MKDKTDVILSILVSFACGFILYLFNYLTLPFAIITFLLVFIVSINLYFLPKLSKVEITTRRNSLVLNVIVSGLIQIQKLSRTKRITITQFVNTFSEAVEGVLDTITKDYFFTLHSSNPRSKIERRKRELLEKARLRRISYEEGQELQRLLEEQKKQHEANGDIGGAILVGLLILFVLGVIAALSGGKEED